MLGQPDKKREMPGWRRWKAALAVAVALLAGSASAQQAPMPEDLAWKLLELGRVIDPPKTAALYAPMQQKEPYQGVKIERDVKYGPADRHLLDVFMPEANSSARPVLIYVHGGGFVAGNKRNPGSPFYDNIMLWAAKNGFVGVNATYRLAPALALAGGRRRSRRRRAMGFERDRRARRRSGAHLSDGTIRRRGSRRELRVASRTSQGEGRRARRRDHGLGHLRPHRLAARRCRARLFRLRSLALCGALLAAGACGRPRFR